MSHAAPDPSLFREPLEVLSSLPQAGPSRETGWERGRKPEDMGLTPILRVEILKCWFDWFSLLLVINGFIPEPHFFNKLQSKKKSALALMIWLHDHVSEYVEPHQTVWKL